LITIRKAIADDKVKIQEIINNDLATQVCFECPPEHTMVVECENNLLGVGALDINGDLALIKFVYIVPVYRNQGFGDGLVRALINYADRRGVKRIYVISKNEIDYFKRFGFEYMSSEKICEIFEVSINERPFMMELDVDEFFNNCCCH